MILPDPPLLVISDRAQARRPLAAVAEAAFLGGCRWFSLREKDLPPDERRAVLAALLALGRRFGAVVTAHEDVEAVAETGADGVHLPAGVSPAAARARFPGLLIGASAHSAAEAAAALREGADYVTLGPVFASASKPGYGPALGLDGLAAGAAAAGGAVVALGGVGARNAASCLRAGARGVAVMGEVMRAAEPRRAVARLVHAVRGEIAGSTAAGTKS